MSIDVVTFGCRLNIVESEAMRQEATAAGHRDLTVINTCAVTAEAARQSRQAVRRAARERPGTKVVVTGCAAEIEPARFRGMAGVAAMVPNAEKSLPATWRALLEGGPAVPDGLSAEQRSAPVTEVMAGGVGASHPRETMRHTRAFVEVQNGCDHRCTFCIIPFGRGVSRSVPATAVTQRVRALVEAGAQEVVLTGVDVTAYADAGVTLGQLARRILAEVPDLPRLRLSSLDCIEADPALLACLAEEPRLMPHLHLSIQAGADLVLKRMARRHRHGDVLAFCRTVRRLRPDTVFGADFIAGFPTETEPQFVATLELIDACDLSYIHAFPFSARPGTPADRMPPVPAATVRERALRLRQVGAARLGRHLDRQIGQPLRVLSERGGAGHAEDFTRVRLPPGTPAGLILKVVATRHDGQALDGWPEPQSFGNHAAE